MSATFRTNAADTSNKNIMTLIEESKLNPCARTNHSLSYAFRPRKVLKNDH